MSNYKKQKNHYNRSLIIKFNTKSQNMKFVCQIMTNDQAPMEKIKNLNLAKFNWN